MTRGFWIVAGLSVLIINSASTHPDFDWWVNLIGWVVGIFVFLAVLGFFFTDEEDN